MAFLSDLAHRPKLRSSATSMQTTGDGIERNLRLPSPKVEFVIVVFTLIAPLVALLWVYDIDRVEILAFTGDGVEILREIIKDQIDQTK
jgi:hypothetical protein